jgi:hypothetical protein
MRKLLIATLTGLMVSLTAVAAAGAPAAPRAAAPAAPRAAVQGTLETLAVTPTQPDTHEGPGSCVRVGTRGAGGRTGFLCLFHAPPEGQDCHTYFKVRRIVGGYNCRPERGRGLAIPTSVAVPTAVNVQAVHPANPAKRRQLQSGHQDAQGGIPVALLPATGSCRPDRLKTVRPRREGLGSEALSFRFAWLRPVPSPQGRVETTRPPPPVWEWL